MDKLITNKVTVYFILIILFSSIETLYGENVKETRNTLLFSIENSWTFDSCYFVEFNDGSIQFEKYKIIKGAVILENDNKIDNKSNDIINNNNGEYYLGPIKLQESPFVDKNFCGGFCKIYRDFYKINIEKKRIVCRNLVYRRRKWNEVSKIYKNTSFRELAKKVDLITQCEEYKRYIDRISIWYIENKPDTKYIDGKWVIIPEPEISGLLGSQTEVGRQ